VKNDRLDEHPALRFGRDKDNEETVVSDAEIATLWPKVDTITKLIILTGCRVSEIAELPWSEVDLAAGEINIPGTRMKKKKPHTVFLSTQVKAILASLPRTGELVFDKLPPLDRCGLKYFTRRDLRRTFATGTAALGHAPHVVDFCLAHVKGKITGIYNKHTTARRKESRGRLGAITLLRSRAI
jgi:integrase